jgi:hypothetical protein
VEHPKSPIADNPFKKPWKRSLNPPKTSKLVYPFRGRIVPFAKGELPHSPGGHTRLFLVGKHVEICDSNLAPRGNTSSLAMPSNALLVCVSLDDGPWAPERSSVHGFRRAESVSVWIHELVPADDLPA